MGISWYDKRTCGYCHEFHIVRGHLRLLERIGTNQKMSNRYCKVADKRVLSTTLACQDITRAKRFWCAKPGQWMEALACINRQRKKVCNCNQGKIILSLSRKPITKKKTKLGIRKNANRNNKSDNL